MDDSAKMRAAQADAKDAELRLAAEFGQTLVRENAELKARGEELAREIAEEVQERRRIQAKLKGAEKAGARKLADTLEHAATLKRDNEDLAARVRMLEAQAADLHAALRRGQEISAGGKTAGAVAEILARLEAAQMREQSARERCSALEMQAKEQRKQRAKLASELDHAMEECESLREELDRKERSLNALRLDKRALQRRVRHGLQQLAERAELEHMVDGLSRANAQLKGELAEARDLVFELRDSAEGGVKSLAASPPESLLHELALAAAAAKASGERPHKRNEAKDAEDLDEEEKEESKSSRDEDTGRQLVEIPKPPPRQMIPRVEQHNPKVGPGSRVRQPQTRANNSASREESEPPPCKAVAEAASAAERRRFEHDPIFFHFHMAVQTVRINLENLLGFGPEIGRESELSPSVLYVRALQEGVQFFEYDSFIKAAYKSVLERRFAVGAGTSKAVREANKLLRAGAISVEEYDQIRQADANFAQLQPSPELSPVTP